MLRQGEKKEANHDEGQREAEKRTWVEAVTKGAGGVVSERKVQKTKKPLRNLKRSRAEAVQGSKENGEEITSSPWFPGPREEGRNSSSHQKLEGKSHQPMKE